jgi:hypothetical protein
MHSPFVGVVSRNISSAPEKYPKLIDRTKNYDTVDKLKLKEAI